MIKIKNEIERVILQEVYSPVVFDIGQLVTLNRFKNNCPDIVKTHQELLIISEGKIHYYQEKNIADSLALYFNSDGNLINFIVTRDDIVCVIHTIVEEIVIEYDYLFNATRQQLLDNLL
jgi:hypothetical protein